MIDEELAATSLTDTSVYFVTDAESAFLAKLRAERKPDVAVLRAGWPDFLLTRGDGSTVGVEVKCGVDVPSAKQRACFATLERVGLKVFVWNPAAPAAFTPWREYQPLPSKPATRAPTSPPPKQDRWIYESVASRPPPRPSRPRLR